MIAVSYLVEGPSDRPVAERLIAVAGALPGTPVAPGGKRKVDPKIPGLNKAATLFNPWLIMRDLDHDDPDGCCGPLVDRLLKGHPRSPHLVLRLAVRSVDSWLLADSRGFAEFFGVPAHAIPSDPDELRSPKERLVSACRTSTRREVREGVPPRAGSGRSVGPRYVEMVGDFTRSRWNPSQAATCSPSLSRAIDRLTEHVALWTEATG